MPFPVEYLHVFGAQVAYHVQCEFPRGSRTVIVLVFFKQFTQITFEFVDMILATKPA